MYHYQSHKVYVCKTRRPLSNSAVKRRLDFGESLPEVIASIPDLFPGEVPAPRRKRTSFTTDQKMALEKQFEVDQYLSFSVRKNLAESLNLSERVVKVWFRNRRHNYYRHKLPANSLTTSAQSTQLNRPTTPRQLARLQVRKRLFQSPPKTSERNPGLCTINSQLLDSLLEELQTSLNKNVPEREL